MAYDICRLTKRTTVVPDSAVPPNSHPNGSRVLPPKGSLLIWGKGKAGTTFQTTGHVAVVVNAGPSFVTEQNVYDGHICAGSGAHPCHICAGTGAHRCHSYRVWAWRRRHLRCAKRGAAVYTQRVDVICWAHFCLQS